MTIPFNTKMKPRRWAMPAITVKNIPSQLYERLKLTAQIHRRSLNSEIIACLEREWLATPISAEERIRRAQQIRAQIMIEAVDPQEIDQAIDTGRP
jgi:plasmid stability protein